MFDLKFKDNDIVIENNDFAFSRTLQEKVASQLNALFYTDMGSWFLDLTYGIPYLTNILGKNVTKKQIDTILLSKIATVSDIDSIKSYSSSLDNSIGLYKATFIVVVQNKDVLISFENKPVQAFYYPPADDNTPHVDCGSDNFIDYSNKLYHFINIDGLSTNLSTWNRTW